MEDIDPFILDSQWYGYWGPGVVMSQGISSHGIGLDISEYSCLISRKVGILVIHWLHYNHEIFITMLSGFHYYVHPVVLKLGGLVQERCYSSALAMELCLSCTNTYQGYPAKRALPAMLTHGR